MNHFIHSHAHQINNKQDLNVRNYTDGLEPKPPVNLITIFKFQNWVVGHLSGPVSRVQCKATTSE